MLNEIVKLQILKVAKSLYLEKVPRYKECKKNTQPFFLEQIHLRPSKKFLNDLKTNLFSSKHKDFISNKLASIIPDAAGVNGNGLGTWSQSLGDKDILHKFVKCIEDFIGLVVYRALYEEVDFEQNFEELWNDFQQEIVSEELRVRFFMPVSHFYWSHNGAPEQVFEGSNVKYCGFENNTIYYSLMSRINSSYGNTDVWDEIDKSRILLVADYEISPPFNLGALCSQAFFDARKAIFPVQLTSDYSIHIDCAVPHLLGNYCTDRLALLKSYYDHDCRYEHRRDVDQYEQEQLRQASYLVSTVSNDKVAFVDSKMRQYASRLKAVDSVHWSEYKSDFSVISPYIEKIVDLVQILEGNIGECGKWNADYMVRIIGTRTRQSRTKLHRLFYTMYEIRNKYLHADIYSKDGLYNILLNSYQNAHGFNHDKFADDIELFSYHVKRVCLTAIMQPDIRDRVVSYHISKKRSFMGDKTGLRKDRKAFPRIKRRFKVDW